MLRDKIWQFALLNSLQHDGQAQSGPVLGRLLAEHPELKADIESVVRLVQAIVQEVNQLSLTDQRRRLEEQWPSLPVQARGKPEERQLPPLPHVDKYATIHLRFCPNPDGALHLGGCRAAILDDEYVKRYEGVFTLRFDDTDPRTKSPILEAYDWIREDLEWLGVSWHHEVYQSDRLELYYAYAEQLIASSHAYVCTCDPPRFRAALHTYQACPCRHLASETHLHRWRMMLEGRYREGDAVVRIKTDLTHPNPAVREWPALRIIDGAKYPHPRVGDQYRVWPLFAYACAIDDHELEISHILRGKEHVTNSERARFLYEYLGWTAPDAIHYGRLRMTGTVLSKSKIRDGIDQGLYTDWSDPRLGTLQALRRRGFVPQTIRQFMIDLGPKPVDVQISWRNIESLNRRFIDPLANRYFFVSNPVPLIIEKVEKPFTSQQWLHPDFPDRGYRTVQIVPHNQRVSLLVAHDDRELLMPQRIIRLMGLFNITVREVDEEVYAEYHSDTYAEARDVDAPLIHWLPAARGIPAAVIMTDASMVKGLAEDACRKLPVGEVIQFERFGFVRIDAVDEGLVAYFTHH